jgi:hypothetical protein
MRRASRGTRKDARMPHAPPHESRPRDHRTARPIKRPGNCREPPCRAPCLAAQTAPDAPAGRTPAPEGAGRPAGITGPKSSAKDLSLRIVKLSFGSEEPRLFRLGSHCCPTAIQGQRPIRIQIRLRWSAEQKPCQNESWFGNASLPIVCQRSLYSLV